jgi:NitT/TauT family transport system substrate-binding protein
MVLDPIPLVRTARTEFAVQKSTRASARTNPKPTLESRCNFRHSPAAAAWPLLAAALTVAALPLAHAQTPIKFQLDWRFEGPAALFLVPVAKGYFKAAGLDVTIDAGNGSGGTVTRVASGTYDMGFADMAALMEFHANNPDAPNKPVAVMMVYNNTPAAVLALKKSGITKPADLNGKKLGAPVFDAGRKAFPIFAKANNVSNVPGLQHGPAAARDHAGARRHRCHHRLLFTSLLNLEARGVKAEDIVVMPYPAHGVKLYGNAIIVSPNLMKENPQAVKAFLSAFSQGRQGRHGQPRGRPSLREGARRHHQRRRWRSAACAGHRRRGRQPRRARRGLRRRRARAGWR